MNPIQKAITDIKFHIPTEILTLAFTKSISASQLVQPTIDEQIESVVIRPKVLSDLNLVGGQTVLIPVDKCGQEIINYHDRRWVMIVYIPFEMTEGKHILMPLSLTFAYKTLNQAIPISGGNSALRVANAAFDFIDTNIPVYSTSNLELIGPNIRTY